LQLELRAVRCNALNEEVIVLKYSIPPIMVRQTGNGTGTVDVSVAEQAINEMQTIVQNGINTIDQKLTDFGYPYVILTQSQYDALTAVDANKLYVITG
jgi:hypothetical protein